MIGLRGEGAPPHAHTYNFIICGEWLILVRPAAPRLAGVLPPQPPCPKKQFTYETTKIALADGYLRPRPREQGAARLHQGDFHYRRRSGLELQQLAVEGVRRLKDDRYLTAQQRSPGPRLQGLSRA